MDTRDEQLTPLDVDAMTLEESVRALIDSYEKYGIQNAEEREETVKLRDLSQALIKLIDAADEAESLHEQRRPLYENFCPPRETIAFLKKLFPLFHASLPLGHGDEPFIKITESHEESKAAYLRGCAQGYIEGRLADLAPKRERSQKLHARKRQKPRMCGEQMMTLDDRDAAIVAQFPVLKEILGSSMEAQGYLAKKYGLESDKQVRNIIRRAQLKTPGESPETP